MLHDDTHQAREQLRRLLLDLMSSAAISEATPQQKTDDKSDHDRSMTIPEFCRLERICATTYYKLRKLGHGPVEINLPGVRMIRITPSARRQWQEEMAALSAQKSSRLELRRRAAMASEAGKLGGSPKHLRRRKRKK